MRLFKNGVSAVVTASFVLFLSGLSVVYGANQIRGGIVGMGPAIVDATISLVGNPSSYSTTSALEEGISIFYLTLPTNSIFSLKVEKEGYITSYSTPTILRSDIGSSDRVKIVLLSTVEWDSIFASSGITIQSGKGHFIVGPLNNTTDPGRNLSGIMTAIVKDLSGTSLVNTGNTRYISDSLTFSSEPDEHTMYVVVCNLDPGTVITSVQMSGQTFNSRQAIIYPDTLLSR